MTYGPLSPRASLRDVVRGRARVVGARMDRDLPVGLVSPVESRVAMGLPYGDLSARERAYLTGGGRTPFTDATVIARAIYARLWAPGGGARLERRPFIVSARVDNMTVSEALDRIFAPPPGGQATVAHFVHPHALNLAKVDADLADRLAHADLVLPDGVGLRIAAKLLGLALQHNINGTDLLPMLCDEAEAREIPLVLIGAQPGVAEACARNLLRDRPALRIPIATHGYLDDVGFRELVPELRGVGRCVVLVGMGSPNQERVTWEHLRGLDRATVLTVGGLFDFFSNRIPRAPAVWQEMGLEWLWRLYQEPRRLAHRYLVGNPLFIARTAAQRMSR